MKSWWIKNLGDAMLAYEEQQVIENLLLLACSEAGMPANMAAFIRHESEGRLHCEVKIYISPALASVVEIEGVQRCLKPLSQDLGLFVGGDKSWKVLFPETQEIQ